MIVPIAARQYPVLTRRVSDEFETMKPAPKTDVAPYKKTTESLVSYKKRLDDMIRAEDLLMQHRCIGRQMAIPL